MKCFSWSCRGMVPGIEVKKDDRLGPVVFLGEEGRGRRYEKVALDRRYPPEVAADGRVHSACPRKVVLPPKDGKAEKVFFVLEAAPEADQGVLVRLSTYTGYVRGGNGGWKTHHGEPENVISGYGAFGDAGRVGSWSDGILAMKAGDVVEVYPSRSVGGVGSFALWVDESGPHTAPWREWENLEAVSVAESAPVGLPTITGLCPCYTYIGGGEIRPGIKVERGVAGPAVVLGEEGRGRQKTEVPLVNMAAPEGEDPLWIAAVAELSRKESPPRYYGDQSKVAVLYGLTGAVEQEDEAKLVRVNIPLRHRAHWDTRALRGEPKLLATGNFASGDAGSMSSVDDTLWLLSAGASLVIRGSHGNLRVIENNEGVLSTRTWEEWEVADAARNPEAYVAKGKAPMSHIPAEWIGRVVKTRQWGFETDRFGSPAGDRRLFDAGEGELVSVSNDGVEVNLGWDGRDRKVVAVKKPVWVILDPDRQVARPTPEAVTSREAMKVSFEVSRSECDALLRVAHFDAFPRSLRERISGGAAWDMGDIALVSDGVVEDETAWRHEVLQAVGETTAAAKALWARAVAGEVLVPFTGGVDHRYGQEDAWVVRADGTLRGHDSDDFRGGKAPDRGTVRWDVVERDELALTWGKGNTGIHVFQAPHIPPEGPSDAQRETVARLEGEIAEKYPVSAGYPSSIGRGWGLVAGSKPAPSLARVAEAALGQLQSFKGWSWYGEPFSPPGALGWEPRWTELCSREGVGFGSATPPRGVETARSLSTEVWTGGIREVEARILRRISCEGGVVECLYFHKYGHHNLTVRWRELAEGEVVEDATKTVPPVSAGGTPPSGDAMKALLGKFGRR